MNKYLRSQFVYSTYGKPVLIAGKLSIAANAAVSSNTLGSLVSTAARTGAGEYTITLSDTYNAAQSVDYQLLAATAVDLVPQIKSIDVVTAKTIVIRLLAGATATDPSAVCSLYLNIVLNASSV